MEGDGACIRGGKSEPFARYRGSDTLAVCVSFLALLRLRKERISIRAHNMACDSQFCSVPT